MTDEQFLYKTRKKAYGPFKRELFDLPADEAPQFATALEEKFDFLFEKLGMRDTQRDGRRARAIPCSSIAPCPRRSRPRSSRWRPRR